MSKLAKRKTHGWSGVSGTRKIDDLRGIDSTPSAPGSDYDEPSSTTPQLVEQGSVEPASTGGMLPSQGMSLSDKLRGYGKTLYYFLASLAFIIAVIFYFERIRDSVTSNSKDIESLEKDVESVSKDLDEIGEDMKDLKSEITEVRIQTARIESVVQDRDNRRNRENNKPVSSKPPDKY